MNLGIYLEKNVERFSKAPYFFFYDRVLTYGEFGALVDSLAVGLRELGFSKGDIVHVLVSNSPETLAAYFAIQKIGAIAGPINGWWKAGEVEYLLNDSRGRGLIIEPQYLPILDEVRDRCPNLETVIETGENPRPEHVSFNELAGGGADGPVKCDAAESDPAYIFYTSGTTGNPKGVLLSHKNVLADLKSFHDAAGLDEGFRILIFLPLFHVNAMMTAVSTLVKGGACVLRTQFSAGEFWPVVEEFRVNFFSAVPAVYNFLLADPAAAAKHDRSSLQFGICGAAPMPVATFRQFEETFGVPIVEGYGLTEGTCVSTLNPRDGVRKIGSIGLPCPGQEVFIVDEDGEELPAGESGEIVIRGDIVMLEYWNRPEETAETLAGGVLHTGDVGYKDEDGYIFIVDRLKDMVIRGGENIYPKEIDNILAAHPKIREAAVIGVPDEVRGEELKAFVIASDDSLTEEEVTRYCTENLADFKVPKYVEILEEDFPRNPIGKVLKKTLKEWGVTPRPREKDDGGGATVADIFGTMEKRVNPKGVEGVEANYGYVITGDQGGEWTVCVSGGAVQVKEGLIDPDVTTTIADKDWIALTLGKLDGMAAFSSGRLKVEGDMSLLMKAPKFFKKYSPPSGKGGGEATVADIFGTMEKRVNPKGVEGVEANYGYVITGNQGGEWTVCVSGGAVQVKEGLVEPNVTSTISDKDWIALTLGKLDGMTAFTSGRLKVEGDMGLMTKAARFFKKYSPPSAEEEEEEPAEELIVLKQVLSIPHKFSTGPLMGKFLKELRDNKRILGNKCPSCGRLQAPPREVCAVCRVRVEELVEIGPEGYICQFDTTYYASPDPLTGESRETPYCSAFLILDGCGENDVFWHEIDPEDIDKVKIGARVNPVWRKKRTGAITDIKYFRVIE